MILITIKGPQGAGKSRIAQELIADAQDRGLVTKLYDAETQYMSGKRWAEWKRDGVTFVVRVIQDNTHPTIR